MGVQTRRTSTSRKRTAKPPADTPATTPPEGPAQPTPEELETAQQAALEGGARPVSLSDLDDAERAALRAEVLAEEQAKAAARRDQQDAAVAERTESIRALIDDRDHLRDCPNDGRVELYPSTAPADARRGLTIREVTVVRCVECAGSTVLEEPTADVLARLP